MTRTNPNPHDDPRTLTPEEYEEGWPMDEPGGEVTDFFHMIGRDRQAHARDDFEDDELSNSMGG